MPERSVPSVSRLRTSVAIALVALAGAAAAQGFGLSCPMRVQSLGAKVDDPAAEGFGIAFHGGSLAYLIGVVMFDGAPQEDNELVPARQGNSHHWSFEGLKNAPVLVCRYEGGIALGRTLRPGVRQCTALVFRGQPNAPAMTLPERTTVQCE